MKGEGLSVKGGGIVGERGELRISPINTKKRNYAFASLSSLYARFARLEFD